MTRLYVIRGNSGSGKTTLAHALRAALPAPAMVIEQDHFRRIVLKEKERFEHTAVEETLRRHATKPNADAWGEAEMREWWREHDVLGVPGETILGETLSLSEMVELLAQE